MWMWITAFLNFVLYTLIALVIYFDRVVVIAGWRIRLVNNSESHRTVPRWEKKLALQMLV
jgi:hypothetical protein